MNRNRIAHALAATALVVAGALSVAHAPLSDPPTPQDIQQVLEHAPGPQWDSGPRTSHYVHTQPPKR